MRRSAAAGSRSTKIWPTRKFWKDRPVLQRVPLDPRRLRAQAGSRPPPSPKLLTQLSAASQKHIYSDMSQDITVNNKSPEDAAKAAQERMEQAFAEAAK